MNVKIIVMIAVLCGAILGAIAQLLFKLGSSTISADLITWATNWKIIIGVLLYGIAAVVFIASLKYADLSLLYPLIATTYFWVALFSVLILSEKMSFFNWIGIALIIGGVIISAIR